MGHIVLLGDSVFDNAAYVAAGEDVLAKLKARLPAGWRATLAARDGAVIGGVHGQLAALPRDATHLVISAGGNDALLAAGVLGQRAGSVAEALLKLSEIRDRFAADYRAMLDEAARTDLPLAVCTIYEARFEDRLQRRVAATALTMLNDVITREAARRRVPVIDLRILFEADADYANAIEPSGRGGEKLAQAIVALISSHGLDQDQGQ